MPAAADILVHAAAASLEPRSSLVVPGNCLGFAMVHLSMSLAHLLMPRRMQACGLHGPRMACMPIIISCRQAENIRKSTSLAVKVTIPVEDKIPPNFGAPSFGLNFVGRCIPVGCKHKGDLAAIAQVLELSPELGGIFSADSSSDITCCKQNLDDFEFDQSACDPRRGYSKPPQVSQLGRPSRRNSGKVLPGQNQSSSSSACL